MKKFSYHFTHKTGNIVAYKTHGPIKEEKNGRNENRKQYSNVACLCTMEDIVQAYFVVMESREFIDYYDEFAIRIAFLTLQGVYEQIMIAENMGNIGFENFIHLALDYTEKDAKKLFYQANIQGISVNTAYQYIVFHQCNEEYNARNERNTFLEAFQQSKLGKIMWID